MGARAGGVVTAHTASDNASLQHKRYQTRAPKRTHTTNLTRNHNNDTNTETVRRTGRRQRDEQAFHRHALTLPHTHTPTHAIARQRTWAQARQLSVFSRCWMPTMWRSHSTMSSFAIGAVQNAPGETKNRKKKIGNQHCLPLIRDHRDHNNHQPYLSQRRRKCTLLQS